MISTRDRGFTIIAMLGATIVALSLLILIDFVARTTSVASPLHLWLFSGIVPLLFGFLVDRVTRKAKKSGFFAALVAIGASSIAVWALAGVAILFTSWLLISANRFYALPIACIQYGIVRAFSDASMRRPIESIAIFTSCIVAWTFAIPLSFVPLNDLIMSASGDFGLTTLAFVLSLLIVTHDTVSTHIIAASKRRPRGIELFLVAAIFIELALRVDHLASDWIPYHRSYWAGPADFIRQGHWLLWDIPSQYGFLSELAIAMVPVPSVWQGLFLLTALILVVQALMTFTVMRHEQSGKRNFLISLLVCVAIFFTSEAARDPYSARLYPQQGLRFLWQTVTLFCIWKNYLLISQPKRALFYRAMGWAAWALSLFWSFESGVWTTLIWAAFIGTETVITLMDATRSRRDRIMSCCRSLALLIALPSLILATIQFYYYAHLGHGPDWLSYFEFSSVYANSDVIPLPIRWNGPGLIIVGLLCASAAIGYLLLRKLLLRALPVMAAVFMAIWGIGIYYAGEPYDAHVNAILEILVMAFALMQSVTRREAITSPTILNGRIMLLPSLVILVTTTIGEPGIAAKIRAPLMPDYSIDSTLALPAISGELAQLIQRIDPTGNARIILPNRSTWVKAELGLVLPFIDTPADHRKELHAWLPMSPVGPYNTLYTLPLERREVYINRYLLGEAHATGWFIVYHELARCELLSDSLFTKQRAISENFSAAECALR